MTDKLHKTKGIVLRTVKYGETSVIVTIFTALFGIQSYLVNGVRSSSKKGSGKANLFQPAALLDLIVYHNELRQLNRIKEFKWAVIYQHIFSNVPKNSAALFMVELVTKCLKQPEPNEELFIFLEDSFISLDQSEPDVMANMPLFFMLHLCYFFGFRIDDNYSSQRKFLDLDEGSFVELSPQHPHFLEEKQAETVSWLLKAQHPTELAALKLNREFRRHLLHALEKYYALHIADFGAMKTLPIISAVLG